MAARIAKTLKKAEDKVEGITVSVPNTDPEMVALPDEETEETEETEEENTDEESEFSVPTEEEKVSSIDVPDIRIIVPEATYNAPIKEYNDAKKVRVRVSANHRCYVGGEWYFFTKGEAYNVPENVKSILAEANLLAAL